MGRQCYFIFLLLFFSVCLAGQANALSVTEQRELFDKANTALEKRQYTAFKKYSKQLKDYELSPYLDYFYLTKRLSRASNRDIRAFMSANSDDYLSDRLKNTWLRYLAKRARWTDFQSFYQPAGDTKLACHYAWSLYQTGQTRKAETETLKLWLAGKSQPKACDKAFSNLYQAKRITREHLWKRIDLALNRNEVSLSVYLAKRFTRSEDKRRFDALIKMHRSPQKELSAYALKKRTVWNRYVVVHGLKRLAGRDPEEARHHLYRLNPRYHISHEDFVTIRNKIALNAALQYHPKALEWMNAIPDKEMTHVLRSWMVRSALRHQQWDAVVDAITKMPPDQKRDPEWIYWHGRALAGLGLYDAANGLWQQIADERHYYGFLAADALGQPYQMNHKPTDFANTDVLQSPVFKRVIELREVGLETWARREWQDIVNRFSDTQQQRAAVLAYQWGWYDYSIIAANRGGLNDNLDLRFPFAFREEIEKVVATNKLDPAWVMGLLRRESAFRPDARSSAGALGLMQVMPSTGRYVAKKTKTRLRRVSDLLGVTKNLEIGSAYLSSLFQKFDNNRILATAAYNAGPHNVKRWLPEQGAIPADIWVDTIPYKETREYTRAVLSFAVVFGWRMNGESESLNVTQTSIQPL